MIAHVAWSPNGPQPQYLLPRHPATNAALGKTTRKARDLNAIAISQA